MVKPFLNSDDELQFLGQINEATRELAETEEIMAAITELLGVKISASRCAYADMESDEDRFSIRQDYTDGCATTVGTYSLQLFGPRAVSLLRRGETLVINDVDRELSEEGGAAMFNAIGIQAIITCPLVKKGRLRALMAVHQTTPRTWTVGEIALVRQVVERCWSTIERRRAEEKLAARNEELEQFAYRTSHDLKSPLITIQGLIEYVKEDFESGNVDEAMKSLDRISSIANRLQTMVGSILALTRAESANEPESKIDFAEMIEALRENFQIRLESKAVEIRSNLAHTRDLVSQPTRIQQVLDNLVSNAIKYSHGTRSPRWVNISTSNDESFFYLRISDNGLGIPEKRQNEVFSLFKRFHPESADGSGLGLHLVNKHIEKLRGTITFKSSAEGTSFEIRFRG